MDLRHRHASVQHSSVHVYLIAWPVLTSWWG